MENITIIKPSRTLAQIIIRTISARVIIISINRSKFHIIMIWFNTFSHIIGFLIRKIVGIKSSSYFPVKLVCFCIRGNIKFIKGNKSLIRVSINKSYKKGTFLNCITIKVEIIKTMHILSFYPYRVFSLMECKSWETEFIWLVIPVHPNFKFLSLMGNSSLIRRSW